MSTSALTNQTLIKTLWDNHSLVQKVFLAVVGSIAIWVSAKVQIPFYPVPITMQVFVILVLGMVYGHKLALATLLLYFVKGAVGLPVFAGTPEKGIGIVYMIGPTGGYLFGFIPAVMLLGYLAERGWDRHMGKTFIAMVIGNLIIYTFGLLWLGTILGWDKPIFQWGLIPFLLGDALKISLATLILPSIWKIIGKSRKGDFY